MKENVAASMKEISKMAVKAKVKMKGVATAISAQRNGAQA
jgi:hypothetical protein